MELFLDVLGESLVDTAKMLPFLFLAYLFIEYVEHRHGEKIEAVLERSGRWGAIPASLLGCVPQCGFSAIASNFYASRVISLGTLIAVFIATSDEAVPLLVSMPAYWDKLVLLMVIKVLYAIAVGLVLDFVLRGILPKSLRGGYTGSADEIDCHETHDDEEGHERPIWQAALRHTLEIFVFIFGFSLLFGLIGALSSTIPTFVIFHQRDLSITMNEDLVSTVVGIIAVSALAAPWGTCFGWLLRRTLPVILLLVAWTTYIEPAIVRALPNDLGQYLPGGLQLTLIKDATAVGDMSAPLAAGLLVAWTVGLSIIATAVTKMGDLRA